MVKIRLAQIGATNRRKYRIVAIDESKRRNASALEIVGYYDPALKPPHLTIVKDRINYWLSVGAQMTESAKKLIAPKLV